MAQAAAVMMAVGGVMSAVGAMKQGVAAYEAGQYNAQVAEQNAAQAITQSKEEERRHRVMSRKFLGDMRANYSASGVTLEGSPMDILEESAANAELDALNIRHGGAVRAAQYQNSAQLSRMEGESGLTAGKYGAASQLLMSGGQAAYMYPRGSGGGTAKYRNDSPSYSGTRDYNSYSSGRGSQAYA